MSGLLRRILEEDNPHSTVMTVAMMLPSTIPVISLADRRTPAVAARMTAMFVTGYGLAWVDCCVPAVAAQWGLSRAALFTPMGESASTVVSAAILIGAGLVQFSPLKGACITKCRTPLAFLMGEWRDGPPGALVVGLLHGSYCVGCCWALMAVIFVGGTMNLLWMALLTVLLVAEKVMPARWHLAHIVGAGFVAWGAAIGARLVL